MTPKEIVEQVYAAFSKGDIKGIAALCEESIRFEFFGDERVPYRGTYLGQRGIAEFFEKLLETTAIESFEPEEFIVDEAQAAVIGRERYRIKSSGDRVETRWVQVFTVRAGKLVSLREFCVVTS